MFAEIKRYHGNKVGKSGWRRKEITHYLEPLEDRDYPAEDHRNLALYLDLKRAFEADRSPTQIRRFIEASLDPSSGEDIAKREGCSRQAVNYSVRQVRRRLQKVCQALGLNEP